MEIRKEKKIYYTNLILSLEFGILQGNSLCSVCIFILFFSISIMNICIKMCVEKERSICYIIDHPMSISQINDFESCKEKNNTLVLYFVTRSKFKHKFLFPPYIKLKLFNIKFYRFWISLEISTAFDLFYLFQAQVRRYLPSISIGTY